jgi:transcription elongation factor GreA
VQLEKMMRNVRIIDPENEDRNTVSIGITVKLKDLETGDLEEYMIVGSTEADPDAGKISNESPIGAAVLGRSVGDKVTVNTPGGALEFEIVEIV